MTTEHEETTEIAVRDGNAQVAVRETPGALEERLQAVAQRLTGPAYVAGIEGRNYAKVEWWTTIGAHAGFRSAITSTTQITCLEHDGAHWGFSAWCEIRDSSGGLRSTADMDCLSCEVRSSRTGSTWGDNGQYAVKSMAQTRATSKAYRLNLSWLAVLAGLEATPAEEVPQDGFGNAPGRAATGNLYGTCAEHGVPYSHTEKQKAAGYPPSHKAGNGDWCVKAATAPQARPQPQDPGTGSPVVGKAAERLAAARTALRSAVEDNGFPAAMVQDLLVNATAFTPDVAGVQFDQDGRINVNKLDATALEALAKAINEHTDELKANLGIENLPAGVETEE